MTGDYQPGALDKALAAQQEPVPYPPIIAETGETALLLAELHDLAEQVAATITDEQIEERLADLLRRAGDDQRP
jgi:hypothetical protein